MPVREAGVRDLKEPLMVGILGASQMAQGFDRPGDARVLTLAHAVCTSGQFRLGGFFDVDPCRAEAAERKWGCPSSPRNRTAWLDQPWDVVCIATPDAQHADDLRDVLTRKPLGILVEKPVTEDPSEALGLLREAQRLDVALLVDFPRRWHTGVRAVVDYIQTGRLGHPLSAVLAYSGSAVHSAVHMLDLFHTWWGEDWEPVAEAGNYGGMCLTLRRGGQRIRVMFVELPAQPLYVWEMHVYCERGKIELSRSPEVLEVSIMQAHPAYTTHQVLTPLARFDMEEEPLLMRLMETLGEMIADLKVSRTLVQREIDSQIFSGEVLRCLAQGGAA